MRIFRSLRAAAVAIVLWAPVGYATTYQCSTFVFPSNFTGKITGSNNAGYAVGYYGPTGLVGSHGFIRNPQGKWLQIDHPGAVQTQLYAINNNNVATGSYTDSQGETKYFTIDGNLNLKAFTLPSKYSLDKFQIFGINDAGDISGVYVQSFNQYPVFFLASANGTFTPLLSERYDPLFPPDDPSPQDTITTGALNNAGQFLVLNTFGGGVTALFDSKTLRYWRVEYRYPFDYPSDTPDGNGVLATSVNNAGTAVGSANTGAETFPYAPFFLTGLPDNRIYNEMLCYGTTTTKAYLPLTINDSGAIFGSVVEDGQSGVRTNFLAVPLGEPAYMPSATQVLFGPGETHRVTIANNASTRLTIANVRVTGIAQPALHFTVSGCGNDGKGNVKTVNVDPGTACTLTIKRDNFTGPEGEEFVVFDTSYGGDPNGFPRNISLIVPTPGN